MIVGTDGKLFTKQTHVLQGSFGRTFPDLINVARNTPTTSNGTRTFSIPNNYNEAIYVQLACAMHSAASMDIDTRAFSQFEVTAGATSLCFVHNQWVSVTTSATAQTLNDAAPASTAIILVPVGGVSLVIEHTYNTMYAGAVTGPGNVSLEENSFGITWYGTSHDTIN
jgi:hypothetical protein